MKGRLNVEHLKLSVANLTATARQESVLHPYPYVQERAKEAVPMLRQVSVLVGSASDSKKEVLISLRKLMQPGIEPGEALAVSMVIDAINREELDSISYVRTMKEARASYLKGLALAARTKDDYSIRRWQWFRGGIARLEGIITEVNYKTLWDLSALATLNG